MTTRAVFAVLAVLAATPALSAEGGAYDQAEIGARRLAEAAKARPVERCLRPETGELRDESVAAYARAMSLLNLPEDTNSALLSCARAEMDRLTPAQLKTIVSALRPAPGLGVADARRQNLAANALAMEYREKRGATLPLGDFATVQALAWDGAVRNAMVEMQHHQHGDGWSLTELERWLALLEKPELTIDQPFWRTPVVRDRMIRRWARGKPVQAP